MTLTFADRLNAQVLCRVPSNAHRLSSARLPILRLGDGFALRGLAILANEKVRDLW